MTNSSDSDRAAKLEEAVRIKRAAARARREDSGGSGTEGMSRRPRREPARLGPGQRSLWLQHQLEPGSAAYHLASAFRVNGELDLSALERSLATVVSRHRILRSTYRAEGNDVLQIIEPERSLEIERLGAADGKMIEAAVAEARRPFDLESGPLARFLVVHGDRDGGRLLVFVLHHILADERSLNALWTEITECYADPHAGSGPELQYDDYVHWLSDRAAGKLEADLEFWRRQLDEPPDDLDLPFAREVEGSVSTSGRLITRRLDERVGPAVRRVASALGLTPFAVCAFAFRVLLERYTDGRDVAFATPASTRSHPATAGMVGYFLNPVVIRRRLEATRPVASELEEFSAHLRDCLAHASVPFDALLEELSPPRSRDRHPLFQTMFVYQKTPASKRLGESRLEPLLLDLGEAKFDLTLFVADGGGQSEIAVEYRLDRFDEPWMAKVLDHYATILGGLEDGLERPVADLELVDEAERTPLESVERGPALDARRGPLLPERILATAERHADAPALVFDGEIWSYDRLTTVARRVARALILAGVEPGDRVGLFVDRSPQMIAGIIGSHIAGAAYVPLDPAYPEARNRAVLEDADVGVILTRGILPERLEAPVPRLIAIDETAVGTLEPVGVEPHRKDDLPAYVLYTSGSTGRPKGVVVTHGNLWASNEARRLSYDLTPARFLLLPSIAFDSSVAGIFWTLSEGGSLVIPTDEQIRDPRALARLAAEKRITSMLLVPSLYEYVLAAGDDLRSLEAVIVAGEICPPRLVERHFERLPETRLFNEYGPTEATVWATVHEIASPAVHGAAAVQRVPIGRPIPGVTIELRDRLGRRVPIGIPGEAWIAGPTVARGYWNREEATREKFIVSEDGRGEDQRWYRSGDRMVRTLAGDLVFLGRIDEQIKVRGFRIEPAEIEAGLLDLPGVRGAAVVARDRDRLVAFVEAGDSVEGWREHLGARLPAHMVPSRLVVVRDLPRLPNGKVDRRRLRTLHLEAEPVESGEIQVLDDRESALLSLWEDLLGRRGIGARDNFFQLGGHSLLVVEMSTAIERDFGVEIPPADVFQFPTVRELARRIAEQTRERGPAYSHLFPIEPGGSEDPLVFCVPHFFSEMIADRFRGERPVFGLRGVSLRPEGNRGRWRTMRDLGEELVEETCRRFGNRPVIMAGYSFGATMAFEAVRLMEESGFPVRALYLIAPMAVDHLRLGPFRLQIDELRRPVASLSVARALGRFARSNHPFRKAAYRRAKRFFVVQPWRRLLCLAGKARTHFGLPLTEGILYADVRVERFRLHASYRPGEIVTPTVIFNAREPATDAAATWRPFFSGPLVVHEIPDPHLDEESVAAAKRIILDNLDELEGGRAG